MSELEIYKVIRIGHYYPTYSTYIEKHAKEYSHLWIINASPSKSHRYYKICTHPHCNSNLPICLIQDVQTKQVFVIADSAIKIGD